MEITQLNFDSLENKNFDYFIAASGFESRATFQAKKYKGIAKKKLVIGFCNEMDDSNRIENDSFFKEADFKSIIVSKDEVDVTIFKEIVFDVFSDFESQDHLDIYIDYSSMTKNWYASLLHAFYSLYTIKKKTISLFFGYSHGKYIKYNGNDALNRVVDPLIGYCNLTVPTKPSALIIGLGNETNRVYGLKEYFDAVPYLFYSDLSYNEEYSQEVEEINNDFIAETKQENIFKFPVYDLIYTNFLLENLCKVLLNNFRVIIAPCGPKPFALLAMINSLKFENTIEVWRISPGKGRSKIVREATGLISVLEIKLG
jgi:hypothetical protein